MVLMTPLDRDLCIKLREFPTLNRKRYDTTTTTWHLHKLLFESLVNHNLQYMQYLFPNGPPTTVREQWNLRVAQGAWDGAEYSEAARGRRCGHIFKNGEATYSCRTCSTDDTCVLCTRCFDSTDHEGHQVYVSTSLGSTGCCDCGDPEAWNRPLHCSIHSRVASGAENALEAHRGQSTLPHNLQSSIRTTIARALDYLCDVLSCSKDDLRTPKLEKTIRDDEELSRLKSKYYQGTDENDADDEFALVAWNDEKHNIEEVKEQIARACRVSKQKGKLAADEIDRVGRSVLAYSTDVQDLIQKARILGEIKITVSIRSSRDTFREQMCGAIIEWLSDISGCCVKDDNDILMQVLCEEMLNTWRIGSHAHNLQLAKRGIIDHQKSDETYRKMRERTFQRNFQRRIQEAQNAARQTRVELQRGIAPTPTQQPQWTVAGRVNETGQAAQTDANEEDDPYSDDDDNDDDVDGDENDIDDAELPDDEERDHGDEEEEDDTMENGTPAADDDEQMDLDEAIAIDPEQFQAVMTDAVAEGMTVDNATLLEAAVIMGSAIQTARDSEEHVTDDSEEESSNALLVAESDPQRLISGIPQTPKTQVSKGAAAPGYWLETAPHHSNARDKRTLPPREDFDRRVRIDYFILYDLRMWKQLRNNLRGLYITTIITVPTFKRVLGLRFAGLYTYLAQLYLVADREPDHSIINLSLQMLTTPSITAEIVDRGKFLTKLMAILYTFLTKRQVALPEDVDPTSMMSLDTGVLSNRRIYHFFADMRYLLESKFVQEKIRTQPPYLLQFLDFAKLFQGICPNVRAVGEHVEYESDTWYTASLLVRDVARISRQFCDSFRSAADPDPTHICRAIRQAAKATIISSIGAEHDRFPQAEMKRLVQFKAIDVTSYGMPQYPAVDFCVEKEPISFHHALHYTLSWLIESWKKMSAQQLKGLLQFDQDQLQRSEPGSSIKIAVPKLVPEQYILALLDVPLRVLAWLAQMRARMWVRNGMTLRHQMGNFGGVGQREVALQRDIFLLQVGLVICDPSWFLASMIDRFALTEWVVNKTNLNIKEGFEDYQQIEVAEDFVHLLIILIGDRSLLFTNEEEPNPEKLIARKDVVNVLCFKALTHSELTNRLSEKVQEFDGLAEVLEDVAVYRPPKGLSDSGTLRLKEELYHEIDPYYAFYSKSQREEAENVYRNCASKATNQSKDEVFFVPKLRPIKSGLFTQISAVTQTKLFVHTMKVLLDVVLRAKDVFPTVSITRLEALLQIVLHAILVAAFEDSKLEETSASSSLAADSKASFLDQVIGNVEIEPNEDQLIVQLFKLLKSETYSSIRSRIRFVLRHIQNKRPQTFMRYVLDSAQSDDIAEELGVQRPDVSEKAALKKRQALERQARVMAAFKKQQNEFLENQTIDWGADENDSHSDTDANLESSEKTWEYPSGTCIFCQEEARDNQLFGTLALMTQSNVHRETKLDDEDYVREVFATPSNLDQSAESIRPFGVAGQNLQTVRKAASSGSVVDTQRRGVGRGFPIPYYRKGFVTVSCGHIMHFKCFQAYDESTFRRHTYQVARNHPERRNLKEFVCPLCKALGNAFLPVIWKAKTCVAWEAPKASSFDSWLTTEAPFLARRDSGAFQSTKPFLKYALETFIPSLAASLPDKSNAASVHASTSWTSNASARLWQIPSFNTIQENSLLARLRSSGASHSNTPSTPMTELLQSYLRLSETIVANTAPHANLVRHIPVSPISSESSYKGSGKLAESLGFSIAAVEIAQRGVQSGGVTFIDSVPENTLTHLRVLSETVSSYVALGASHPKAEDGSVLEEAKKLSRHQIDALFGNPEVSTHMSRALFAHDIFIFLTECTVFMVPYQHFAFQHVLKLCYLAELVKVMLAVIGQPDVFLNNLNELLAHNKTATPREWSQESEENQVFSEFVQEILKDIRETRVLHRGLGLNPNDVPLNPNDRFEFDRRLRAALNKYALTFVRKALLLVHTRYGADFSLSCFDAQSDVDELTRLSVALGLPSISELFKSCLSVTLVGAGLRELCGAWIRDWLSYDKILDTREGSGMIQQGLRPVLRLPHPAIYELIALPDSYDTLHSASTKHRCTNTGREVHNPCLCLFCGAILCGQSSCWRDELGQGGCFRHQSTCAGSFGIYMIIRTGSVLFMNGRQGSFMVAPYLDRHGETDMGLRRRNQLFLNQQRYDRLFRDVWLNHGLPSAIARKLEADINNGGWETL